MLIQLAVHHAVLALARLCLTRLCEALFVLAAWHCTQISSMFSILAYFFDRSKPPSCGPTIRLEGDWSYFRLAWYEFTCPRMALPSDPLMLGLQLDSHLARACVCPHPHTAMPAGPLTCPRQAADPMRDRDMLT